MVVGISVVIRVISVLIILIIILTIIIIGIAIIGIAIIGIVIICKNISMEVVDCLGSELTTTVVAGGNNSELVAIILGSTLSNRHENWLMVGGRGH